MTNGNCCSDYSVSNAVNYQEHHRRVPIKQRLKTLVWNHIIYRYFKDYIEDTINDSVDIDQLIQDNAEQYYESRSDRD